MQAEYSAQRGDSMFIHCRFCAAAWLPELTISATRPASAHFVCAFEVESGVVAHHRCSNKRDNCTGGDVPGDRPRRVVLAEQPRCDQGCRPARDNRRKLIAERGTAVAQST